MRNLLPHCKVCRHDKNFEIQKDIDSGNYTFHELAEKYDVPDYRIRTHVEDLHRERLITWGEIDYNIRKNAMSVADVLIAYITKWAATIEDREDIKDADVLKAIEVISKLDDDTGKSVDRHEVIVKRDIGVAIAEKLKGLDEED